MVGGNECNWSVDGIFISSVLDESLCDNVELIITGIVCHVHVDHAGEQHRYMKDGGDISITTWLSLIRDDATTAQIVTTTAKRNMD